ncbi:hypothetical protein OUZ56_012020 [Daphnia magna]|uniref:Uncharacterized protein n=1 Tax=Daphnia magna TaxID=35525 RepID=A0ABQ9Z210_9CRUS|nr:hypothetical protein OUZ56_012020 [Daphnia magna]
MELLRQLHVIVAPNKGEVLYRTQSSNSCIMEQKYGGEMRPHIALTSLKIFCYFLFCFFRVQKTPKAIYFNINCCDVG